MANANKIPPCPISPNITPNKNGKTGIANNPGFTSPYLGVPYVLTISWKNTVKVFKGKCVGGFC